MKYVEREIFLDYFISISPSGLQLGTNPGLGKTPSNHNIQASGSVTICVTVAASAKTTDNTRGGGTAA